MKVCTTRAQLREARRELDGTLGLVPTMGALHAGHLSLVEHARRTDDHVAVSIFVNPRQFGPDEDYDSYPRTRDADLKALEAAGVDLVWAPGVEDVYPEGFDAQVHVGGVTQVLEGKARPGHFDGVCTVVSILLNLFAPDDAFFGLKDAQQTVVLAKMVEDLGIDVRLHRCPIVREDDGLALSSRNRYLTPAQRALAPSLHRALTKARQAWQAGQCSAGALRLIILDGLVDLPEGEVDSLSVADLRTLQEVPVIGDDPVLLSAVLHFGDVRLLDNEVLSKDPVA